MREIRRDLRQRLDLPRRPVHRAEDHHQRLRERRGRVLRPRASASPPQPHVGTRRTAEPIRIASVSKRRHAEAAKRARAQARPVSTAADGPAVGGHSQRSADHLGGGCSPGSDAITPLNAASTTPGNRPERDAQRGQKGLRHEHHEWASCAAAAAAAARQRQKADAERLDEAGGRERAGQREQRAGDRKQKVDERLGRRAGTRDRNAWNVSHSLAKPLSGGSPEIATAPTRKTAPSTASAAAGRRTPRSAACRSRRRRCRRPGTAGP